MKMTQKLAAGFVLASLSLAIASTSSVAQSTQRPDLNGLWTNASLTNLQRPQGVDKLVVTPEEAALIVANTSVAGLPLAEVDAPETTVPGTAPPAGSFDFGLRGYNDFWIDPGSNLAMVKGEFRSSYLIDPPTGRVPRLETPLVQVNRNFGARYVTGQGNADGPEALPLAERCFLGFGNTAGPGMMGTLYNSTYQFVQTDDYLTILVEMNHDARIIPLYDSADEARANLRPKELNQWFGDSRGWFEGEWLVVETVNINPQQMAESSVPISPAGKITERFMRYSDTEVVYQFTVEDSNLYSQPWTAELSYHATEGPMYEYACHEGNYAMPGILAGARRAEAEAANQ
ncbi:MAG: hypothetical protein Q7L07_08875 [Pseudohongiella sp.]|jgi:hypothetical protein|nr:hypothetical protein [Pseudohongiella sp.]MDP2286299.1 hypothetical protein [Pseudohongiella sp.]